MLSDETCIRNYKWGKLKYIAMGEDYEKSNWFVSSCIN